MLLDDPSPLVRRALADALAASPSAPPAIVIALAADQPQIAAPVYALSPLFIDADLVDAAASGCPGDSNRDREPRRAAALGGRGHRRNRHGGGLSRPRRKLRPPISRRFPIDRIVERFGHLAAIREALLLRDDIPAATRQTLVIKLSETLAGFVAERAWLDADHAQRIAREACEKATVTIAADTPESELRPLIRHLCASGQLTAGLILRALLSGNIALFEEALVGAHRHAGVARLRSAARPRQRWRCGRCLKRPHCRRRPFPAFKEAVEAMREGSNFEPGGPTRLKRRMIERVLTRCEGADLGELAPLLTLLRRFATEAAREEARLFCDELVADEWRIRQSLRGVIACFTLLEAPSYISGTSGGEKMLFRYSGRKLFSRLR